MVFLTPYNAHLPISLAVRRFTSNVFSLLRLDLVGA
jgi:hypothetical protein